MKHPETANARRLRRGGMLTTALAGVVCACLTNHATAEPYTFVHMDQGGLDPLPYIYSVVNTNSLVTVYWTAFEGPYQVQLSTNAGVSWANVGNVTNTLFRNGLSLNMPPGTPLGSFRISAPSPHFNSTFECGYCHGQKAADWSQTPHASAFDALTNGMQTTNTTCLPCHTVGYGVPTGYTNANSTYYRGVQCENCHGPTVNHAGTFETPAVTQNPQLCGGCHTGTDQPQYDEWASASGRTYYHGRTGTNMHFASTYASTNRYTREQRMGTCGMCHSGRVQHDLSSGASAYGDVLPGSNEVLEAGVGCVTCHDPHNEHQENGGYHLRYPLYSTNAYQLDMMYITNSMPLYAYTTNSAATNYLVAYSNFWVQYNPKVMVCGQCHRTRNSDLGNNINSAPHHSHQYNIVAANLGATTDTNAVPMPVLGTGSSQHGINTLGEQCTLCHVAHTFEVETNGCYRSGCHNGVTDPDMNAKMTATRADVSNRIMVVRTMLDAWAASTNCPSAITNTHKVAGSNRTIKWEYSSVGDISKWGVTSTNTGPSSGQQNLIPMPIRQARFNIYIIAYDESMGVHNPDWARYLIAAASNKVSVSMGWSPGPAKSSAAPESDGTSSVQGGTVQGNSTVPEAKQASGNILAW